MPDLKRLGPRLGKRLPAVRKLLAEADGGRCSPNWKPRAALRCTLPDGPITLDSDDIQVRLQAKEGWAAAQGHAVVVVLATELTPELIREGLARELVRTIQDRRKEMGCQFTDRIVVGVVTESVELRRPSSNSGITFAARRWRSSCDLSLADVEPVEIDVASHRVMLYLKSGQG